VVAVDGGGAGGCACAGGSVPAVGVEGVAAAAFSCACAAGETMNSTQQQTAMP